MMKFYLLIYLVEQVIQSACSLHSPSYILVGTLLLDSCIITRINRLKDIWIDPNLNHEAIWNWVLKKKLFIVTPS